MNEPNRPVNPRRRKRSKIRTFCEAYLPVAAVGLVIVVILTMIISSSIKNVRERNAAREESIAASIAEAEEQARLEAEVLDRIDRAISLAEDYDYEGALAILKGFSGDIYDFPNLNEKIIEYERALSNMIAWDDPSKVVNLSFQLLVADPARGFSHAGYGNLINKNFLTTEEFSKILLQLYENGYILVDMEDIIEAETDTDGNVSYKAKTLMLPMGKKPLMLTQTNVNYNYYLIDSDSDKIPDAKGGGFASKLLWDGTKFFNEMVDANGDTVTGDFDLVPILEKFIQSHPDFSYRGARAILALTGYNGLFGYRTHPQAASIFGQAAYKKDLENAKNVAAALRANGYTLACYTYENIAYGQYGMYYVRADLQAWIDEVVPLLGEMNMLVYAQLSDIASNEAAYSGERYELLHNNGFRYFLGFCNDGQTWATLTDTYVRQGRIMVTGSNLAYHPDWFDGLFDAPSILDPTRGNIPR